METSIEKGNEKAVIYLRVSTEEQCDNYSLETQEDICKKESSRRKYRVDKIFREEGRSAKNIKGRPSLINLLEYCRKYRREIDAVIVYRLDRISRQTADYLAIRKKLAECEIQLISASEPTGNSPTEKFIETMLAGFAQMDNDVRSERTKNGMKARLLAGLSTGYVPLGYINKNGYATKDEETFEKMKKGWEMMAAGTKTLNEMADTLNKMGLRGGSPNSKKYKLRPQTLNRIFRNKFYIGKVVSKKYDIEVQGQHTPMISEEMFYRVQAILDGRNTRISSPIARRNKDNPDFPLRRIVKCKKCGSSFTGAKSKGKNKRYSYYFCPNRCSGTNIPTETMEEATKRLLEKISLKEKTITLLTAYIRRSYFERIASLNKRREKAEEELKKLYESRQALIQKNLEGTYSDEIFKEQNAIIEDKIKSIKIAQDDELLTKYKLENIFEFIQSKLSNLSETYENAELGQKKMLLCSIFPQGLQFEQNAYSNTPISKFYKAILDLQNDFISFGSPKGNRTPV